MSGVSNAVHSVKLSGQSVGSLVQRGDVSRFFFDEAYWSNPHRHVLGLWFENHPRESPQAALRLPVWFSNLLPEGPLRTWIAQDRGVKVDRELQLLLQIGNDLPGAVEVSADANQGDNFELGIPGRAGKSGGASASPWKFSLAGVGLKFSMLQNGDRLTVPAQHELGNWIVKFPDAVHERVPENEYASMRLAEDVGIECPRTRILHRDEIADIPTSMWPHSEDIAYAVERFDRGLGGGRIHIEDFAQVRGFYPQRKYDGSFETVAALAFRNSDHASLQETVRRLVYNLLIGNGDAHLKNWSLIYEDGRTPALSPAYDLVSTAGYYPNSSPEDFGLKFGGSRSLDAADRASFVRLQRLLQVDAEDVLDVVDETVECFSRSWTEEARRRFPPPAGDWIAQNWARTATRLG